MADSSPISNNPDPLEEDWAALTQLIADHPESPEIKPRFFHLFQRELAGLGLVPEPVTCPECGTRLDLKPLEDGNWEFRYPGTDKPELWYLCLPCAREVRLVCRLVS